MTNSRPSSLLNKKKSEYLQTVEDFKKQREEEKLAEIKRKEEAVRKKIEEELENICFDVLALLNDSLIPNARAVDAKVFYLKMRGDYYRYLCEFTSGDM